MKAPPTNICPLLAIAGPSTGTLLSVSKNAVHFGITAPPRALWLPLPLPFES